MRHTTRTCMFLLMMTPAAVLAQAPAPPDQNQDPLGPPTTRGIRMTPGMARAIAQMISQNVFVRHYELDPARKDEAAEALARRMMSMAHQVDAHGAALAEYMITQMFDAESRRADGEGGGFELTPEIGKGIADEILPAMPAIRELIGGVGRDIGPMLSLKQQLKMTGELAMAGTALEAFQKNMERWARGEAKPGDNPFSDKPQGEDAAKMDASGQSAALKSAREEAEKELDKLGWMERIWANYLKEFKSFYELDESQGATADSVLREYVDRAKALMKDAAWRDQTYRSRLWLTMAQQLRMRGVFTSILNSRYDEAMAPVNALGDEFRLRLEEIPTEAQKNAAEARIAAALKERGFEEPEAKP